MKLSENTMELIKKDCDMLRNSVTDSLANKLLAYAQTQQPMAIKVGDRINIYRVLKIDDKYKGCLHMQIKGVGNYIPALKFFKPLDGGKPYCSYNLEFEYRHCGSVAIKLVGCMVIKSLK